MLRLVLFLAASAAHAHIGSPDIFLEGNAGPYPLFLTIRPPLVIPGVAEVEIRTAEKHIRSVRIVPLPMHGAGAKFAPTPDLAQPSKDDPQFFTGALWMMTSGSWQVKVNVDGPAGPGELSVPVPALANRTEKMQAGLGAMLSVLMFILVAGAISIAGAAAREAQLEPGAAPTSRSRRNAWIAMTVVGAALFLILYNGNKWWNSEANSYTRIVYKPLQMKPAYSDGTLRLELSDPGWLGRSLDDFVPDHNHLMHLYVIRLPEMERVWHLHPEMSATGIFHHQLPPMPAGRYALFADVVHQSGLPETLVAEIDLPHVTGAPLHGDDSSGAGHPLSQAHPNHSVFRFEDGSRLEFVRESFTVRKSYPFRFRAFDSAGNPASDMELYMGMQGHAAFVKHDRSVFAHVHPTGSVPMAALSIASNDPHAGHYMGPASLPPEIRFPYGFPQPGSYRIFVQFKRSGHVRTAFFDVQVR